MRIITLVLFFSGFIIPERWETKKLLILRDTSCRYHQTYKMNIEEIREYCISKSGVTEGFPGLSLYKRIISF